MNLGKRGSIKSLVIPLIVIADSTPSCTQGECRPRRAIKASHNFFPADQSTGDDSQGFEILVCR
jgi:hypothetical protein